ncbi:MAG: hypothetical protein M0018_12485 [Nitrospiraceae bacterium]|nr:hypothetical protein [Nitrospiraceae bacterium]
MKKLKTVLATVFVLGLLAGAAFAQGMGGGGDESGGTSGGVTNPSGDMNTPGGAMNTPGMENTPGATNPGSGY